MNLNPEIIEKAKLVSIVEYLSAIDIHHVKEISGELLYFSPITNERTPSFFVNIAKNVYYDYSSNNKGDVINLVQKLLKNSFQEAVAFLLGFNGNSPNPPFSFSGKMAVLQPDTTKSIHILNELPLRNTALLDYVNGRGISEYIGKKYLKEIIFKNKDRTYFAVGFKNDAGGYELRNSGFKGKTKNGITVFNAGTKEVILFEGFFDFLSALQIYEERPLQKTCIVLNSNVNLHLAFPYITGKINAFLDNDPAGKAAIRKLLANGYDVADYSERLYPNYKDLNEWINAR